MKTGTADFHKMLLKKWKCENQCCGSDTLLKNLQEILHLCSTRLANLDKIQNRRCPQNLI